MQENKQSSLTERMFNIILRCRWTIKERSHHSSHPISSDFISSDLISSETEYQWVRYKVTQFAVTATNQNEIGRAVLSDWSQPRRTGSFHSALTARWNEVRWDKM